MVQKFGTRTCYLLVFQSPLRILILPNYEFLSFTVQSRYGKPLEGWAPFPGAVETLSETSEIHSILTWLIIREDFTPLSPREIFKYYVKCKM
jgi:hypothetical protein